MKTSKNGSNLLEAARGQNPTSAILREEKVAESELRTDDILRERQRAGIQREWKRGAGIQLPCLIGSGESGTTAFSLPHSRPRTRQRSLQA